MHPAIFIESAFFLFTMLPCCFGLFGTIFWVWMLIDCATKERAEGNDKIIWIIIILLTHLIGALLYFFVRRPQRKRDIGQ